VTDNAFMKDPGRRMAGYMIWISQWTAEKISTSR
jgi:hypothetical protein